MTGRQTMWSGFGKSVNTFFVQLEQRAGVPNAVDVAERLGINWHTDIDRQQASPPKSRTWGAFTLGVADTTPLEMANAYATVAADGTYCQPLPVTSITDVEGKPATWKPADDAAPVEIAAPRCHRAISSEVARGALDAARCVTGYKAVMGDCGSWSTAPKVYKMVGRPVAGKTGTTDDNRAAWFIGMTPGLTTASFIADPDNPFHVVGSGENHAKPMLSSAEFLHDALAGTPYQDFAAPSPLTAYGADGKHGGAKSGSRSTRARR
jgi:membrane carboxypeptidase/penicillin-binding protein